MDVDEAPVGDGDIDDVEDLCTDSILELGGVAASVLGAVGRVDVVDELAE